MNTQSENSAIDAAMAGVFALMRTQPIREAEPNYEGSVADLFIRLRGRSLTLSPIDIDLICQWRDRGIPLRIVLKAIEEVMHNHRGRRIRSISYCAEEIEASYAEWLEMRVGANE